MSAFRGHPQVRALMSLDLDARHFAFIGSAPLFARGWITAPGDIDVVARGPAWEAVCQLGEAGQVPDSATRRVSLPGGGVEVFDGWFPERWPADEMIDGSDVIDGLRFVSLDVVVAVKRLLSRPRDLEHLRVIARRVGTLALGRV